MFNKCKPAHVKIISMKARRWLLVFMAFLAIASLASFGYQKTAFANSESVAEEPDKSSKDNSATSEGEQVSENIEKEEIYNRISQNCSSIKLQLERVQKEDSRYRVYLGAQFEIVSTSLMQNLNLRLVKSNLAKAELTEQQTNFAGEREHFKNEFISYSKELENLIAIKCKDKPEDFYNQLVYVREKRSAVQKSVTKLREMVDEHRKSVESYKKELYDTQK